MIHVAIKKIKKKLALTIPTDTSIVLVNEIIDTLLLVALNPHMHEIFLQRYCMKWVLGDPLKEMIN